jgi:hypothetical protein
MSAKMLLAEASVSGVELWAEGGMLRYRGNADAVRAMLPKLKARKSELLAALAPKPEAQSDGIDQVRRWLQALGESDPATIAEVLDLCANDAGTMSYYAGRASEPLPDHREASEADLAHGDMVRDKIEAGWCWSAGRWRQPGAGKAEPSPDRDIARDIHRKTGGKVRCRDCAHASPVDWHNALVRCGAGLDSGTPTGLFWSSDLRTCEAFRPMEGTP